MVRRSALLGLHGRYRHPLCRRVWDAYHRGGYQHAGTARVIVNVQARLSLIVWTIIRRIVVMMMTIVVMMIVAVVIVAMVVMVVAMMNMVFIAVRVGMNEKARKRADRRSIGRGDDRRQRKRKRRRPNQGNPASACSLQSRQHPFVTCRSAVSMPAVEGRGDEG